MTRASTCSRLLAVCLLPLIGQPALAQDDEEGVFDRTPKTCILASSIDKTDAIDDQNILFYMRDRGVYRNTLPRKCPGLERENRMSYELTGTRRLCSTDTITVLEDTGLGGGGLGSFRDGFTCRLGEFVPLSSEEIEDLELLADENRRGGRGRRTQSTIETSEVELPKADTAGEAEASAAEPAANESDR